MANEDPRHLIPELCRLFYTQGWVSGTGGGISIREDDHILMAPSGVQKERIQPEDLFTLDLSGEVVDGPVDRFKVSECRPLFMLAYEMRGAGAVLHSHSANAVLATLATEGEVFEVTHLEMLKGIQGLGYRDRLAIPIIENTPRESQLEASMREAMEAYPDAHAVLVRRHGVYVWGKDWVQAKTQAECYDYLFEVALRMRQIGLDPAAMPAPASQAAAK
ncbi:MAG: methylthioribulose 1-phosphate dehydratase [Myxococcota bacterium]